jgi:hypothetical protein
MPARYGPLDHEVVWAHYAQGQLPAQIGRSMGRPSRCHLRADPQDGRIKPAVRVPADRVSWKAAQRPKACTLVAHPPLRAEASGGCRSAGHRSSSLAGYGEASRRRECGQWVERADVSRYCPDGTRSARFGRPQPCGLTSSLTALLAGDTPGPPRKAAMSVGPRTTPLVHAVTALRSPPCAFARRPHDARRTGGWSLREVVAQGGQRGGATRR